MAQIEARAREILEERDTVDDKHPLWRETLRMALEQAAFEEFCGRYVSPPSEITLDSLARITAQRILDIKEAK